MAHFTQNDLLEITNLAESKALDPLAREDFEMYVLLRAIPKLVEDLSGIRRLELIDFPIMEIDTHARTLV
jgi:hypothetical protein